MTKKYIVHGINCDSEKKTVEYTDKVEAQNDLKSWKEAWRYFKDLSMVEGDEDDFYIEVRNENEYMDKLRDILTEYEDKCREYEELKNAMHDELDEKAFWEWYRKNDKPEYPLTGGQNKALHLWIWNEGDELVWDDFVWDREAHDFIDTLRKAGVETLVITNQSTALMENMHWFQNEGCKLMELCEVETGHKHWKTGEPEVKMGVRFAI